MYEILCTHNIKKYKINNNNQELLTILTYTIQYLMPLKTLEIQVCIL